MTDNPFETDQPADPWSEPEAPNEHQEDAAAETEVSATLKAGTGFDAPWLVARGPNAKAIVAEMRTWFGEGGLIDATAKTADAFRKATGNDKPASGGAAQPPRSPQSSLPPGVEPKSCKHGEMVFRTGTSAKGPWKGFFCPTPKDAEDKCRPVFVK